MPKPGFLSTPLPDLARRLLREGPLKVLPASPRRVRIVFGGGGNVVVADSTRAVMVWEHPYYPNWYLPLGDFAEGGRETSTDRVLVFFVPSSSSSSSAPSSSSSLPPPGEPSSFAATTIPAPVPALTVSPGPGVLDRLVRVEFSAAEAWLEEDTRVYVHPKDPFKRVDIVWSSRPVRIFVGGGGGGREVAHAQGGAWHLYETGLPVRFYLPVTAVLGRKNQPAGGGQGGGGGGGGGVLLRSSETTTECPYKGVANYYDLVLSPDRASDDQVGEQEDVVLRDVVWYYRNPTVECAAIAGALCFYNEKVDIELDGKMLERPKTPFS
ncbi:uncharacterized protein B0I36DRAFT_422951 [Microdochium trichocladiopsis]|uniref:DUF427 domain-containing protein n=1 Tax=Microdochium trichocladiopsis TaxID=1682393 RepID=A0A9P9BPL8_9PEZI|nr:uncharacterized protein B0I36DRAFT_422951 [Microdochium trichocladiopsis]KAH7029245.1 hypothetical protein B0I36DRAFT_422951 [Microdochium trichocladiopsis]